MLNVLRHPAFVAGDVHTGFLDEFPCTDPIHGDVPLAAAAAALAEQAANRAGAGVLAAMPSGWRNNPAVDQVLELALDEQPVRVTYRLGRDGHVTVDGNALAATLVSAAPDAVVFDDRGLRRTFRVGRYGDRRFVDTDDGHVTFTVLPRHPDPGLALDAGSLVAPMPGNVLRVLVAPGDVVAAGQPLVVVEAMKMEHQVLAPAGGTVAGVHVDRGDQVDTGQILLQLEESPDVSDHPVRIANCSGFYGDRISAAREMVEGGPIDVLTGDWLAELTMLILWKAKARNADGGYANTFLTQMEQVLGTCADRGIKVVTNAGGLNPAGCADRVRDIATKLGVSVNVAHIEGDDLLDRIDGLRPHLSNLDTGEPLTADPVSANAYLGGWGIARALADGADVVVCPRVTDAAVVVGPAAWWWGWSPTDWDRLAGAVDRRPRHRVRRPDDRRQLRVLRRARRRHRRGRSASRSPRSPPTARASSRSTPAPAAR